MSNQPDTNQPLVQAVEMAACDADFLQKIGKILSHAQSEIYGHNPACNACGKCCDFQAMDHRLYVSTGELALLTTNPADQAPEYLRCSYQIQNSCTARENRPLGCRIFFCTGDANTIPDDIYEKYHQQITALHQACGIPYFYSELSNGLLALADNAK